MGVTAAARQRLRGARVIAKGALHAIAHASHLASTGIVSTPRLSECWLLSKLRCKLVGNMVLFPQNPTKPEGYDDKDAAHHSGAVASPLCCGMLRNGDVSQHMGAQRTEHNGWCPRCFMGSLSHG